MAIDLARCNGCNACVVACKVEHNSAPGIFLTAILEKEVGQYPHANREFYPVLCNHCERPPCVPVCPTGATYQRQDGIVLVDWETCIGCGACIQACPYEQRFYVRENATAYPESSVTHTNPDAYQAPAGVPVKCDFCFHRVDQGRAPACVETCPTQARLFGRLGGDSALGALISRRNARTLLPAMGTSPHVFYF